MRAGQIEQMQGPAYTTHSPVESAATETGGRLTIDLGGIVANWRELARRAAPAQCSAVVKADAYGCGIEPVVTALINAGCTTFFVACLSEARRVRACAPGAVIYVLGGLHPGSAAAHADGSFRPVLSSIDDMREWSSFCVASAWPGAAALHVDTGMNRLGLAFGEAVALADDAVFERCNVQLVMSHLAIPDDPSHPLNARQIGLFREVRSLFPGIGGSLANSSGIFLGADATHDLVRPGAALYGVNPTPMHANPMRPVVTLEGLVLHVRDVEAGDTVGYGAAWTARRPTRLAIVSLGYADGFPRSAGASDLKLGADVLVAGHLCPLAGRVSMDLFAVDVTDVPGGGPHRGDWVKILGDTIGVDELASHAGTIGYEILTRLGRRYHRTYVGA